MTLSERNTFFKIGIIFCTICTLFVLTASFLLLFHYQSLGAEDLLFGEEMRRPVNFFQGITGFFLANSFLSVHISLVFSVLFSLIGIVIIHSYFERTSSPEILYIAIFTVFFAFEVIRLALPFSLFFNFPSVYMRVMFRILLFARFFSIFSLFAASLCAAGLEVQKIRNVIFVIIISSFVITLGVPIDVLNWDTSLNMVNGYSSMFRMIELIAIITTIISFFIAAKIRDSKEYTYVALGVLLVMTGRNILTNTDNWAGLILGISSLSIGTYFLCSKIHKIHLWL